MVMLIINNGYWFILMYGTYNSAAFLYLSYWGAVYLTAEMRVKFLKQLFEQLIVQELHNNVEEKYAESE